MKRSGRMEMRVGGSRLALRLAGGLLLGFLGLCLWIERQGQREEIVPADAIIVLGAAQWDGRPSPVLQARLDRGIELYRQGYAPLLVLTGGVGAGDCQSEAAVGRDYALTRGVPAGAILIEEQSRTTVQNLQQAGVLLTSREARSVLLVSDPFHMARACWMARDLGLQPHSAPTRASPISEDFYKELRYLLREGFAVIVYGLLGK